MQSWYQNPVYSPAQQKISRVFVETCLADEARQVSRSLCHGDAHCRSDIAQTLDDGDEQIQSQGVLLVLDRDSAIKANRMKLDFVEIEGNKEFIFINPNDPQYRPPAQSSLD